ncbi:hypothetical protein PM082_012373 [Marasmius tenuissimus]|nr:hypothetical protein PM082_012373 [Marasmius tenuissimus]
MSTRSQILTVMRFSSAAICDTGIAVSLCYYLQQIRTGFKRTDKIIDYLMILALKSGCLTSIASIACLLTASQHKFLPCKRSSDAPSQYLIRPKTWVYVALSFVISRLYANTLLAALNTRQIPQLTHEMDTLTLPDFLRPRHRGPSDLKKVFDRASAPLVRKPIPSTANPAQVLVITEIISRGDSNISSSSSNKVHHTST